MNFGSRGSLIIEFVHLPNGVISFLDLKVYHRIFFHKSFSLLQTSHQLKSFINFWSFSSQGNGRQFSVSFHLVHSGNNTIWHLYSLALWDQSFMWILLPYGFFLPKFLVSAYCIKIICILVSSFIIHNLGLRRWNLNMQKCLGITFPLVIAKIM